jgi:tetratricopeptide (TPR) repeat protein
MSSQKQTVEKLFDAALQFKVPGEREAFLRGACGDDSELLQRVEGLLRAHEAGSFLEEPPTHISAKTVAVTDTMLRVGEGTGDRVGRYKLLQVIGEGGFGWVYMAEQTEPVRRKVALKVIKLGMDTREVLARFEAERQALALMDHPNIAQVLDGGTTPTGRPYFVMELIKGVPMTQYCDEGNLSPQERVELFCKVCHAVHHAHQKGIIHRDLKPRNILVTEHDGEAVPKVIDFGVAKAIGSPLTDKTLFTRLEQMIGTPIYMSPEQTGLGSLDLDTRTDIYSLGVLLYELLTGTTPLERETLEHAAFDEMRRMIRETQPPRPSTRLRALGDRLKQVAKVRRTEPAALARLVHGDLDWIVMKSLDKDRKRRYESANEMATDLQRHLNNEPVVARPPSQAYRFGKFVRRNKVLAGAVGAIFLSILMGLAVSAWGFFKERKARLQVEEIAQLLNEALKAVAPSVAKERDTVVLRKILGSIAERSSKALEGHPDLQTELPANLAKVYFEIGEFPDSEKMLQQAVSLLRKPPGNQGPQLAQALADLGVVLRREEHLPEAEKIQREALAVRRKLLGERHADVAESYSNLGAVLYAEDKLPEAVDMYRLALDLCRKLGNQQNLEFQTLNNLALALADQGKAAEAETNYRQALVVLKSITTNDIPELAGVLNNFSLLLEDENKFSDAEQFCRRALAIRQAFLPANHLDIAESMNNLAMILRDETKLTEAELFCRQVVAMRKQLSDGENPGVAQATFNLGNVLRDQQKHGEAEESFRKCLAIREKIMPEHWQTFCTRSTLGACLADQKKYAEAEPFLVTGFEGMKRLKGPFPAEVKPRMQEAVERLVQVCEATGQSDRAAEWRRELQALEQPPQERKGK